MLIINGYDEILGQLVQFLLVGRDNFIPRLHQRGELAAAKAAGIKDFGGAPRPLPDDFHLVGRVYLISQVKGHNPLDQGATVGQGHTHGAVARGIGLDADEFGEPGKFQLPLVP